MKEQFEKVHIKTEKDLPKQSGVYFVCDNENGIRYFHPKDQRIKKSWLRTIDWYLQPIEPKQIEAEKGKEPETYFKMVRGKATEEIDTPNYTIETGDTVEGYLNSWHLMGCYSIQVELNQDCGNTPGCSGIIVVNVPVEKDSIVYIDGEQLQSLPKEPTPELRDELMSLLLFLTKHGYLSTNNLSCNNYLQRYLNSKEK